MKTLGTITMILSFALVGCTETSDYNEPIPEVEEPAPAPEPEPEPAPEPADEPAPEPEPEGNDGLLACSFEEIEPIVSCALEACVAIDPATMDPANPIDFDLTGLMTCALANCSGEVLSLSPDCTNCLFNGVADGSTDALIEHCANFDDVLPGGLPGGGGGGGFPLP